MPFANLTLVKVPLPLIWILLVVSLGSAILLVTHLLEQGGRATILYHLSKTAFCFAYQSEALFDSLAEFLSLRFDPKSFFFLCTLLLLIHQSLKELIHLFYEKIINRPHLTISCDCDNCRETRIQSYLAHSEPISF